MVRPAVDLHIADLGLGPRLNDHAPVVRIEAKGVIQSSAQGGEPTHLLDPALTKDRKPIYAFDSVGELERVPGAIFYL